MHPARLFVLCGLPGSGTTTRAIELEQRFPAIRLNTDDWMSELGADIGDEDVRAGLEAVQRSLTAPLLRAGTSVIIEWGTWSRSARDDLRVLAREAGALVHLEFLDVPVDELWERVSARTRERLVGSRAITRQELAEWSSMIDRPTVDEWLRFDPMPPVRAGERPGSPAYPYGSWRP